METQIVELYSVETQIVELYLKDGSFVTTVEIIQLAAPPDIICWGLRVFALNQKTDRFEEAFVTTAMGMI